jgi:hypothetical protein
LTFWRPESDGAVAVSRQHQRCAQSIPSPRATIKEKPNERCDPTWQPARSWPLPLYDLALMTAVRCAACSCAGVELSLLTPEAEPLGIFGRTASAAVRDLLDDPGVALHTSGYAVPGRPGSLDITPGGRPMKVDRVVTVPRLAGPRLRGIPCDRDGFVSTDLHGRLPGLDGAMRQVTPRRFQSSTAAWPPSRPTPSPRQSPPRQASTSIRSRFIPSCAPSC